MTRNPDEPCAGGCGKLIHIGGGSSPRGQAMCRACRYPLTPAEVAAGKAARRGAVIRIHPLTCVDCGVPTVRRATSAGRLCLACAPGRKRASQRAKNHRRRLRIRVAAELTPAQEVALRRAVVACPLCAVTLTAVPFQPSSAELDHILPIAAGGAHVLGNVRIICRLCNSRRPIDGSDLLEVAL